jgi:hypothetical protein
MSRYTEQITWDDVPHLSEAQKAELRASIPPHQLDARTKGVPLLGSGAIYPVSEADILVDPFPIPDWMAQAYALDVGWNRTAALWAAIDRDNDVAYLYNEHYVGNEKPPIHAAAIKSRGEWIPGVIDPASRGRQQGDGEQLLAQYKQLGLNLTIANNAVEAGIYEVWTRLSTGRLKVFRTLQNWLREFRIYRRDEKGKVVKENDHLMDCTRYLSMTGLSVACIRPADLWAMSLNGHRFQADYDPFAKL